MKRICTKQLLGTWLGCLAASVGCSGEFSGNGTSLQVDGEGTSRQVSPPANDPQAVNPVDRGATPSARPDPTVPPEPDPTFPVGTNPVGSAADCDVDQLNSPAVYGGKVKTLLTGLPLDGEELAQLESEPEQLPKMIDAWMSTPAFRGVLTKFFQTAFQQNQIDVDGLTTMLRRNNLNWGRFTRPNEDLDDLLVQNLRESFARTALRIVEAGEPFNQVVTTDRYEMTTAMLMFHAFLEHRFVNDRNQVRFAGMPEIDQFTLYRNRADAPPASEALDPSSPNFLHFYVPEFENLCLPPDQPTYVVDQSALNGSDEHFFLFGQLVGRAERVFNRAENRNRPGNPCRSGNTRLAPVLTRSDFSDWRTVRLRPARADETLTRFYRLDQLRGATELAVRSDRLGFFTTLGFFATWPTNEDNQARVTLNQTLITALGESFDGQTVADFSPPNLDEEHSAPGTACYGCHQTLDPMREFFLGSYSFNYGRQDDREAMDGLDPEFIFRGVQSDGFGVRDLATVVARHPDFAGAWIQKMCFYANSAKCPPESEAFAAVARSFEGSNLNFKTMLRDLFASPLVTHSDCVDGGSGQLRSISRRDLLCTQLSNRLGVENICGEGLLFSRQSTTQRNVAQAMGSIPQDTFARGEADPIIISQTGLFTRATREVVCTLVAERAFTTAFQDLSREAALTKMVDLVMGHPVGDPRHDGALKILEDHVRDGRAEGATERVALQSALVVACMSPGLAGLGF